MTLQLNDENGRAVPAALLDGAVNLGAGSILSVVPSGISHIRIAALAATYIAIGSPVTIAQAGASGAYMPSDSVEYFAVNPNTGVATSGGALNIVYCR